MHPLISLAKSAVENYIKEGKTIKPPEDLPELFYKKKSGSFVTIEKEGQLRACIGTYLPTQQNISQEVIHNAIAAASQDYRFEPIRTEELVQLSYTVYVLGEPEPVTNYEKLDPEKFGIIVKTGHPASSGNKAFAQKSGLLLPDLPGINTAEQQIYIACQKARIDPNKEKILIYRFTAEKYHE